MSRWSGWITERLDLIRQYPRSFLAGLIACTLVLLGGTAAVRMARYGSPSALVGFGCAAGVVCFADLNRAALPDNALVYKTGGYDGQFFFYYAAELYGGPTAVVDFRPLRVIRPVYSVLTGWIFPAAGAPGLVYALTLVPLLVHIGTLVFLWMRREAVGVLTCILFALNPFSLKSLLLNAADGIALSFALASAVLLCSSGAARTRATLAGAILLALSVLTKETMLATCIGLAAAGASSECRALISRGKSKQGRSLLIAAGFSLVVALIWWAYCGFHVQDAGRHGSFPFTGLAQYLAHADAVISGRSFLVVLLPLYAIFALVFLYEGFAPAFVAGKAESILVSQRTAGFGLLAAVGLISFATAEEYWVNFANIVRLFAAGLPPLLVGLSTGRAGKRYARLMGSVLLLLAAAIVRDELTGKLLAFEIWP